MKDEMQGQPESTKGSGEAYELSDVLGSDYLDMTCPGCGDELTISNAGGYRTYCDKCVEAMPELPNE